MSVILLLFYALGLNGLANCPMNRLLQSHVMIPKTMCEDKPCTQVVAWELSKEMAKF